jgi:tyrosine-specific transport protein
MENAMGVKKGNIISAMFLVAGTCIGGGMLALPVATGINGFVPSIAVMFICYLAMTATALLLVEASLWMKDEVHVNTLATRLLGNKIRIVVWFLFLFISYASIVGYTAGAGLQVTSFFKEYFGLIISQEIGSFIFIVLFGGIFYAGSYLVGRINSVLFVGMLVAYFGIVMMGLDEVHPKLILRAEWTGSYLALPLVLTAFSFQTMVPSLTPLLMRNAKALRFAIIGGTTIAFLIYLIWQFVILGIVPVEGSNGLKEALIRGEPATQFLRSHVEGVWLVPFAEFFGFFAIATSFIGIALGLFDFLADGLKIKKQGWGKFFLTLLVIIPTYFIAVNFERIFLIALDLTGGYGDTILNGLIPVAMVWVGRYHLGYKSHISLPGGKPLLIVIFAFFLAALVMEILIHSGHITSIYQIYDVFIPEMES